MKNYFETPVEKTEEGKELSTVAHAPTTQFYQRGLGLKQEVKEILKKEYYSDLVAYLRNHGHKFTAGGVTVHLAKEFGFCYGVDRAVDYAYQTREKFPDRRIFITGEIIHNPHVNNRLLEIGIQFLSGQYSDGTTHDDLQEDDVVILPAFGVSIQEFQTLKAKGCILVDTTCGSVLNVWKRVEFYAKNGYTSVIHGKYFHEETIATSSQALKHPDGKYLVVRNMEEARRVCDYIVQGGDKREFMKYFEKSTSSNFDPDSDLTKIGIANQTTMLSTESLAIADELKKAMVRKFGAECIKENFETFDTICSATQERQDAVVELVNDQNLDLMVVIGGFNSSNTNHLADITSKHTKTYHIDDPACILDAEKIRHKRVGTRDIVVSSDWLPSKDCAIGITAGASTPNNKIGEVIEKIMRYRGIAVEGLLNGL